MAYRPQTRAIIAVAVSLFLGCSQSSDSPADTIPESPPLAAVRPAGFALCESILSHNHAATKQFWDTFAKNDTAMRAMAITALEQAVQQNPSEAEFSLLAGLANLWHLAVPTSAEANNQLGFLFEATSRKTSSSAFPSCVHQTIGLVRGLGQC